jgi:hypothetical protein
MNESTALISVLTRRSRLATASDAIINNQARTITDITTTNRRTYERYLRLDAIATRRKLRNSWGPSAGGSARVEVEEVDPRPDQVPPHGPRTHEENTRDSSGSTDSRSL